MKKLQPLLILSLSLALSSAACLQPQKRGAEAPKQPTAANKTAAPAPGPAVRVTRAKDVSRYLKIHEGRFISCFDLATKENPALAGDVRLEGVLYPDGSIKAAVIKQGTLRDVKARTCMIGVLSGITIPEAKVEHPTRFVFPLQFGR